MPQTPFQIDYTNKDYEAFRNMMINSIPLYTPEWTDTSESDFGIVLIELLSNGLDILSYYQDRALNESYLPTAQLRRSVINLCKLIGYTLSISTPSKVYVVFTLASPAPTDGFTIYAGTQVSTQPDQTTDPIVFETDATFTIPAGKYGNETDETGKYLYQVSATQGETIFSEIVGSSNGQSDQQYTLTYVPVINDSSLVINVKNAAGVTQQWTSVVDFLSSQPTDQVYTVSVDENGAATITFGSGSSGAIPDTGYQNITATYRIGGGTIGNVGSNTITNLMTSIAGVSSVNNPAAPYQLGQDPETLDHAKMMAPVVYRTNMRAVTLQDYADLVLSQFSNNPTTPILKTNAINATNSWDYDVNVYVIRSDLKPLSTADKTAISSYLDTVRMITNKYQVLDGVQVPVTVSVLVTLLPNYVQSSVQNSVIQALTILLQTANFQFGQNLPLSTLISTIDAVSGVDGVQVLQPTSDVVVASNAIIQTVLATNITVSVSGGVVG